MAMVILRHHRSLKINMTRVVHGQSRKFWKLVNHPKHKSEFVRIEKVCATTGWLRTYQCCSQTNLDKDHKWPNKHHSASDLSNMSSESLTIALLKILLFPIPRKSGKTGNQSLAKRSPGENNF